LHPCSPRSLFAAVAPNQAQAHRSRCHQAHSCPSDHATYRWYGRAGGLLGRWLCVHRSADERNSTFKIRVVYGGRVYFSASGKLGGAVRSQPIGQEDRVGGFPFRLERKDGTPAEPRTFEAAVPNWKSWDTIHLGRERTLRVVAVRDDDADQPPTLVVEDLAGPATSEQVA
jgi:hypothetical protein